MALQVLQVLPASYPAGEMRETCDEKQLMCNLPAMETYEMLRNQKEAYPLYYQNSWGMWVLRPALSA